jgi:hypothetical protein
MPALNHWPDKPVPYARERSEVLQFIKSLAPALSLKECERVMGCARALEVIRYHPADGLWRGTNNPRRLMKAIKHHSK